MCPNQEMERCLLPDSHVAHRVFMSMLNYLHAEDRRIEDVHAEIRDRYEVFCHVVHNFPMPMHDELEPRPPVGNNNNESLLLAFQLRSQQRHRTRINEPSGYYELAGRRRVDNDVDMVDLGYENKDVVSSSDDE